jgi:hypothetical protein
VAGTGKRKAVSESSKYCHSVGSTSLSDHRRNCLVFTNKEQTVEGTTQSEVAMRKSIALMNDAVIVVSERRKNLLPLVLIVTGSIWLSALVFQ